MRCKAETTAAHASMNWRQALSAGVEITQKNTLLAW